MTQSTLPAGSLPLLPSALQASDIFIMSRDGVNLLQVNFSGLVAAIGTLTTANTATNLAGGTANQIPYQTAAGATAFIPAPGADGLVLSRVSGALTWVVPGATGILGLSKGGTGADLSATGGASQVLKQVSAGAAVTVGQLAASDLGNGTTGSGAVVLATSPVLVTPNLGTPSAVVLTAGTGLPLTTGVAGILPVTSGGTGTATPGLVQGTNVTITGAWPNQTINSTANNANNVTPDTHPSSPTVWDDEFEFGSSLDTTGARFAGANAWSTITASGSTFTNNVSQGSIALTNSLPSGTSTHTCAAVQAAPSGTWEVACKLSSISQAKANSTGGLYIGNGGTGKLLMFGATINTSNFLLVQRQSNPTTQFSNPLTLALTLPGEYGAVGTGNGASVGAFYLKAGWDGTNINLSASFDGRNWQLFYSETGASFLGGAPSAVGIISYVETTGAITTCCYDWFRRLS